MACTCRRARGAGAGPGLSSQVQRAEEGRLSAPKKDRGMEGGRQGCYLIGGVGVPHDQLPILRGTY